MVSTKGYLPTGFSTKDLSHLSSGTFCFCANCRIRLFPLRIESSEPLPSNVPAAVIEEVNVDELQPEALEITDLADQKLIPNEDNDSKEEEEE